MEFINDDCLLGLLVFFGTKSSRHGLKVSLVWLRESAVTHHLHQRPVITKIEG